MMDATGITLGLLALMLALVLVGLLIFRLVLALLGGNEKEELWGISQTFGNRQVQADRAEVLVTGAGILGIMADGIGKANTGKVSAHIALDTAADAYEPYKALANPEYFFRTVFGQANLRIQQTLGQRRGGACLGLVYLGGGFLHYGLAGDIRIALFRGGEVIPLSQGHTLDVLARQAYDQGRISRREAIWSMEETRRWNYLGMDGFREIELPQQPIRLKPGDLVLMMTRGIWQELSWAQIEDLLAGRESLKEKARQITWAAGRGPGEEKENGSVMLMRWEVTAYAAD